MRRLAIIVGHLGQDGRLLWERLFRDGYALVGLGRGTVSCSPGVDWSTVVDITSAPQVETLLRTLRPQEIYHLAAHHHSAEGRPANDAELVERSFAVHVTSLANFLDAMQRHAPAARLFYAASSHVFGEPRVSPQDESCALEPRSIYGISKAAGTQLCRLCRRDPGLFASVGILFNHESPHRPPSFLSRRIIDGALAVAGGRQDTLVVGDLSAAVDWGWAPEYVDAMHRILQIESPGDFVVATGEARTVREFVELAFRAVGLDWKRHVKEDPSHLTRRTPKLVGDASRVREATGWAARVRLEEFVPLLLAAASARSKLSL